MLSAEPARGGWQKAISIALGLLFFGLTTWSSCARWASFGYRTFDLAYYVQAIWQLIHGRFEVTVEYVPLLGNHVEPIVLLAAPLFFVFRHPMLFVALQNALLATICPVGYDVARRIGLSKTEALLLAAALLVYPATGYIALHEFHPEALAAPFLLLMLRARLLESRRQHWIWFVAALACKENIALLLVSYCAIQVVAERDKGWRHLRVWYAAPGFLALAWLVLCTTLITPSLNGGSIDYGALYSHLGSSGREILWNAFTRPGLFLQACSHAATHGNLIGALFLPLLCLPVLRQKWILVCAPIFLQHLLSWRSSEWTIYFHYAAPIVPLLWFAAAEASLLLRRYFAPLFVFFGCIVAQLYFRPMAHNEAPATNSDKTAFIAAIPPDASVVAPLPYLSHLAMREQLHSLHYILKGLKTLSRERFAPPPVVDFVLIDYGDSATFDARAGYYHPAMRTVRGEVIPSSDSLLHEYLQGASWESRAIDELTLLRRRNLVTPMQPEVTESVLDFGGETKLIGLSKSADAITIGDSLEVTTTWGFGPGRTVFPWFELHATNVVTGARQVFQRGLCAPEAGEGVYNDRWRSRRISELPVGTYTLEGRFFDETKRAWAASHANEKTAASFIQAMPIGTLRVAAPAER